MAAFKVRVACDLFGSKHNAMFLFKPPPTMLYEIVAEAERFYQEEAESRKPEGHAGPAFKVRALQLYDQSAAQWRDVEDVSQLADGCQLYAIQQPSAQEQEQAELAAQPAQPAAQTPRYSQRLAEETNAANLQEMAFLTIDTKADGVITLDEMVEVFNNLPLRFTPTQIQDLFVVADTNHDGVITREEFALFATRFPTVIDSIYQKKSDDEVLAREVAVLRGAEAALAAEQEVEKKLLEEAANASKRVRDLMSQIADHKLSHEVQLQKKPMVDAQQQQLIEQELTLAAQKERLRQAHEDIRRDIEDQLNAVSTSIGMPLGNLARQQQELPPPSPSAGGSQQQHQHQQQQQQHYAVPDLHTTDVAGQDETRLGSVSENTSSFFLPSESPRHPGKPPSDWNESLPPTPSVRPRVDVGAEVEACNFDAKPEFNGLRGRVVGLKDDGRVSVEFILRNGLTLDMLQCNVKAVAPASSPAIGESIESSGYATGTAVPGNVDLRGKRGRVVGFRGGKVLCEFAPLPGIFDLSPHHIVLLGQGPQQGQPTVQQAVQQQLQQVAQQQQQQSQLQALERALRAEIPSQGNSFGSQPFGVSTSQPQETPQPQQPPQQQQASSDMLAELERARHEAENLRRELAAERSRKQAPPAALATSPQAQAALARLGQLGQSPPPPVVSALPSSPINVNPPATPSLEAATAPDPDTTVWGGIASARTVSPARRPRGTADSFRGMQTLLPSTQEILRKVGALTTTSTSTATPSRAVGQAPPSSPPVPDASNSSPMTQLTRSGKYQLGPIDPTAL